MTLSAWQTFKPSRADAALTGEGVAEHGGRWNLKGVAVVYTAPSAALAVIEVLVRLHFCQMLETYLTY